METWSVQVTIRNIQLSQIEMLQSRMPRNVKNDNASLPLFKITIKRLPRTVNERRIIIQT